MSYLHITVTFLNWVFRQLVAKAVICYSESTKNAKDSRV